MTESQVKPFNLVGAWIQYEELRKKLEEHVTGIELSKFNLQFGSKTEAEFKSKLREIQILVDKIVQLIETSTQEAPRTIVS